jgi:hypothetical protein
MGAMEFVCEICDRAVYSFGGSTQTRCAECDDLVGDEREDAERSALRDLLHDAHEKGRARRPARED